VEGWDSFFSTRAGPIGYLSSMFLNVLFYITIQDYPLFRVGIGMPIPNCIIVEDYRLTLPQRAVSPSIILCLFLILG
jgi:hypothetical protein